MGPYKEDGQRFGCNDIDVCNGAFVDGQYVYVGTSTFPYVLGCWGPGPSYTHSPTCTSNGCDAYSGSGSGGSFIVTE